MKRRRFWWRRKYLILAYGLIALSSGGLALVTVLIAVSVLSHMVRH